ncbi:MAG: DJ-1/PfpI family protein [Lachnospiraceae bacterium]|nr:DJ-1/PfpI family protein [Robinsoniella sp.]MDY3765289.1 DJ-1/PfpI family protein [Lachnospiraceae bacterium]
MNVNIVLFDDFETLDAFGAAQIFGKAPEYFYLKYLSVKGGVINSSQGVKVWTEPLEAESIKDILVIPGGRGARKLLHMEQESLKLFKKSAERADICMMIENGSAIVAQTGLLYHRQVADYEYDDNWKRMFTAGFVRIPKIRWMADGKYYSCSTSAASLDMALSIVADNIDIDVAEKIAKEIGYTWDPENEEGILR